MTSQPRLLRALAIGGLPVLLAAALSGQVPDVRSDPPVRPIAIDGRTDDWAGRELARDRRSGVEFAFQNDGTNLYILFIARGPDALKSLDSTGLAVLVRPAGTKASRGVHFVNRSVPTETYLRWRESQGPLMTEDEEARVRQTDRHDLCLPFAVTAAGSTYGPLLRLSESDPPAGAVAVAPDSATYELRLPLAEPARVAGGIGLAPGGSAEVSFTWGGAEEELSHYRATRVTPPSEAGELSGAGETWAQELLHSFDSLSSPRRGTRRYAVRVGVSLSEIR